MPIVSVEEIRARKCLTLLAASYAFFIVYGSLIPFAFEPRSFEEIGATMLASGKNSVLFSLTDRATNIFLSVPLAFFTLGAAATNRLARNVIAAVLTWAGCVALAVIVETLQTLTPDRVASLGDIYAQALGAVFGILLWPVLGGLFLRGLRWLALREVAFPKDKIVPASVIGIVTVPYLAFLLALNGWFSAGWAGFPAAAEAARETSFLPFFYQYSANIFLATASVTKYLAVYAPIGILYWLYSPPGAGETENRRSLAAAFLAGGVSAIIEAGKLFLGPRHPDITNVLLAACAALAAHRLFPRLVFSPQTVSARKPAPIESEIISQPLSEELSFRSIALRVVAIACFCATAAGVMLFPLGAIWLGLAIALYALALFRYPALWLFVIPALLPSFDLAPWTGRFFLNEFDLFIFATVGVGLWHWASSTETFRLSPVLRMLLWAFAASTALSLLIGLLPLQTLDFNAFGNYYSRYNALRAAKGMLEALALVPFLFYVARQRDVFGFLCAGMAFGLATAAAASIWERALFPGLFDFTSDYRISALFSSMHTGDSSVEAYLVVALPFVAGWAFYQKSTLSRIAAAALFALSSYALFVTFSRGGYAAYVLMFGVLVAGSLLTARIRLVESRRVFVVIIAICAALGGLIAVMALESSYARSRFATTESDLGVRLRHWRGVIGMMDQDWQTSVFGMGLGRYPDVYFHRTWSVRMPSTMTYLNETGNTFLRLGAGAPAYLEQIVSVEPGEDYRITIDLRPTGARAALNVMICQRTFFRSFNCKDSRVAIGEEHSWTHREAVVNSGNLGAGPWFARRIVKFVVENTSNETAVDIDNVQLTDRRGINLLANGDFSRGSTFWFYSSFDHLNWHVKNIFVQLYFEQGWLGLVLFTLLALTCVISLWSMANRGEIIFLVPLASLVALLSVGLFGSPLDTPRLDFIFYFIILAADVCAVKSLSGAIAAREPNSQEIYRRRVRFEEPVRARSAASVAERSFQIPTEPTVPPSNYSETVLPVSVNSSALSALGPLLLKTSAGAALFVVCAWVLMHSSIVPYNVRNLLHPVHPFLSLIAMSVFLYWTFGFPVLSSYAMTVSRIGAMSYPLMLACHSVLGFFLLSYSVSFDRIHKIVGAPILGWHGYLEPALRFMALFAAVSLALTYGTLVAVRTTRRYSRAAFIAWLITAGTLAPLLYWIVVSKAATDNLVELMAGSGTPFAAAMVFLFVAAVAFSGALSAAQAQQRFRGFTPAVFLAFILSVPIAYIALHLGLEQHVEKYGKDFSALQFLLSRNRESYAQGFELIARYLFFHAALVGLIAMVQYPFFFLFGFGPSRNRR